MCAGEQTGSHKSCLPCKNGENYQVYPVPLTNNSINQSTESTGGSIVSECRLGKWSEQNLRLFHLTPNFL